MGEPQVFLSVKWIAKRFAAPPAGESAAEGSDGQKAKMIWYEDLYVGESIIHKKNKIKWKIRHNAGQIDIYVIALASNKENLLDIIPAQELLLKGYPKRQLSIIGLAKGYQEAVEVAASVVDEVYHETGGFAVRSYLAEKRKRREAGCQSYC